MVPSFKFSACFFAREKGLVMMMRSEASQRHGARLQVFSVLLRTMKKGMS